MPALPLDEAGKYVAGAYVVFFTLIVLYVAIISAKIARIDRELTDLVEIAEQDEGASTTEPGGPDTSAAPASETRGADASATPPHGDPVAGVDTEPRDGEPVA
jgi:hypothetical protein